ncbi:hypothetical protein [Streptomyces sp. A0958]|uniref:hypothetical protein n=1 Tax=Streptomyces sp. A0958 TaxID=2563101 RepID=UPI0019D28C16|nr:hypothetical protein [Streptomyces sp. A0958]
METYAVRVEADGGSLTYTGDSGPCRRLVELARGNGAQDELVPRLSEREGITEVTLRQDEVD